MKTLATLLFVVIACLEGHCFTERDSLLYQQRVYRDDRLFSQMFANKRGLLILTDDSLKFIGVNRRFSFSLAYEQVASIEPYYGFLLPNRIKIQTIDGRVYRLFTYRNKNILAIARPQVTRRG